MEISIDQNELAVRIGEVIGGVESPNDATAIEALDILDDPEVRELLLAAADAAAAYFTERLKASKIILFNGGSHGSEQ